MRAIHTWPHTPASPLATIAHARASTCSVQPASDSNPKCLLQTSSATTGADELAILRLSCSDLCFVYVTTLLSTPVPTTTTAAHFVLLECLCSITALSENPKFYDLTPNLTIFSTWLTLIYRARSQL
jgi:hypothetical protein